MTKSTNLGELILRIYRAAEDPGEWASALTGIREAVDGSGAAIVHQEFPITGRNVNAYSGFSDEAIRAYEAYYYQVDPWGRALKPQDWVPGRVIDGREVVESRDVARSEWFADFGGPNGCAKSMFGILEPLGARVAALTINRRANQADFSDADRRLVLELTPHLRQAFRLHRRIADATGVSVQSFAALDRLPVGVILLDASSRPVFLNVSARHIANQRDGLLIDHGELVGASPAATGTLRDAIATAVRLVGGLVPAEPPAAFALPRPSGSAPLRVVVVPFGLAPQGIGQEVAASAAVFVSDPDADGLDDLTLVAKLFDLTPTEARVAARLVNGETVREMSMALELSPNTVRWHLKHVLQKAEAKTQAQFVSRVLRSPAWLRRRG